MTSLCGSGDRTQGFVHGSHVVVQLHYILSLKGILCDPFIMNWKLVTWCLRVWSLSFYSYSQQGIFFQEALLDLIQMGNLASKKWVFLPCNEDSIPCLFHSLLLGYSTEANLSMKLIHENGACTDNVIGSQKLAECTQQKYHKDEGEAGCISRSQ